MSVAVVALLAVFLELYVFIQAGTPGLPPSPSARMSLSGNTERIADSLFSQFSLPFEAASLLLLVAIVGAVWTAKKKEAAE